MKNTPTVYTLQGLADTASGPAQCSPDGKNWFPARPQGFWSIGHRWRATWLVWTGRADAVVWPGGQ